MNEAQRVDAEKRVLAILDDAFHDEGYPLDILTTVIVKAVELAADNERTES